MNSRSALARNHLSEPASKARDNSLGHCVFIRSEGGEASVVTNPQAKKLGTPIGELVKWRSEFNLQVAPAPLRPFISVRAVTRLVEVCNNEQLGLRGLDKPDELSEHLRETAAAR